MTTMEKANEVVDEVVEEVAEVLETPIVTPNRRQRLKRWVKAHRKGFAIGAGTAALAGAGLAVKAVLNRNGIETPIDDVADVIGEVTEV